MYPLFPLLNYLQHFAEKRTVFELYILQVSVQMWKIAITLKIVQIEEKSYFFALFPSGDKTVWKHDQIMYSGTGQLLCTTWFCWKNTFLTYIFFLQITWLGLKIAVKDESIFFSKRRIFSKTATVTILKHSPMDFSQKNCIRISRHLRTKF